MTINQPTGFSRPSFLYSVLCSPAIQTSVYAKMQFLGLHVQGEPKSEPAYLCNNFVYCQPIFIIFSTHTL